MQRKMQRQCLPAVGIGEARLEGLMREDRVLEMGNGFCHRFDGCLSLKSDDDLVNGHDEMLSPPRTPLRRSLLRLLCLLLRLPPCPLLHILLRYAYEGIQGVCVGILDIDAVSQIVLRREIGEQRHMDNLKRPARYRCSELRCHDAEARRR